MKYRSFSEDLWSAIDNAIAHATETRGGQSGLIAAFDADGTLWDTDLGENFFKFEINNSMLPHLPENAWQFYRTWKKFNPRGAYLWLAQIHQGLPEAKVLDWAAQALPQPLPIFPEIKKLIDLLKKNEVRIFVVTASISWAVKPAMKALDLDPDCIIGVQTLIENGLISARPAPHPLTFQEGKVQALLHRTQGQRPFLAAGNTLGDYHLLEAATAMALALTGAIESSELWQQESALQNTAKEKGWYCHRF
jgi:HAD superfamily phosphoserine phosphatase-like hydrolase